MSRRQERISSLLKRLAAGFFLENIGEIGVLASVTKAEISADLQNAKIFFSVLPENREKKILKQLFALKKDFRRHISRGLKTKFIPRVIFLIDDSLEKQRTINEERLRWVLPIVKKEVRLVDVEKVCPYGKRSLERWVTMYKKSGKDGLEPKSTARKTQNNETPIRIKEHII